jgi:hypothetical protein
MLGEPVVGLDRDDVCSALEEAACRLAGSGPDLEHACALREATPLCKELVDERGMAGAPSFVRFEVGAEQAPPLLAPHAGHR